MLLNYEELLKEINRYDYKEVFILGYYNITSNYNDIFIYTNYKLKKITNNYKYIFIDLNTILKNNKKYFKKTDNFYLNKEGINKINEFIVEKLKNN